MKQQIFASVILVVLLMITVISSAVDLEKEFCVLTCKAEHLDRPTWQRDTWCNTKCEANAAWSSAKRMFG